MTTTGYVYDLDGNCIYQIAESGDVFDATKPDGAKIGTARDGVLFNLSGMRLGDLEQRYLFSPALG